MGNVYKLDGTPIAIGGCGSAIDFSTYENNLANEINEDFKTANANFTLSNCAVSSNGLVCSGFCTAKHTCVENLYCEKAIIRFVYNSALQIGVFLSSTLAYLDSSGSLSIYKSYGQSSTLPSSASATVSVTLVSGHEYTLSLYRKGFDYAKATLRDLESGNEVSATASSSNSLSSSTIGIVVFSGSVTVAQLIYKTPLYNESKMLIVGDSITWASVLGNQSKVFEDGFAYGIIHECFQNNGIISGQGGLAIKGGIARIKELVERGYKFDYVLVALGTNVDWDLAANWSYAAQIAKRRETFADFDDYCTEHGATLLWGAPPANPNDDLTESLEEAEADTTTLGFPSRTILRKLIIDVFGDRCIRFDLATMTNGAYDSQYFADGLHTNYAGQQRQFEFAKAHLELLGIPS